MNQNNIPTLSVFSCVNMLPLWNDIDILPRQFHTRIMPRTRMDELIAIAEENDGLLTSKQARNAGILDSVLVRLAQRGRLERTARGVYRIAHFPQSRFSQYREALLWAEANRGSEEPDVALSHETALALYGISDANPQLVHITVPKAVRLRRERPKWIAVHHDDLHPIDVTMHEGLAVTTVARTIRDVLDTTGRSDLARQAVADATRTGFIRDAEATRLKHWIDQFARRLNIISTQHQGDQA
jgi:predicted transcriptional regulator of viral defense system